MIDNELKVMLSLEEYTKILNHFVPDVKMSIHTNYYYDTSDLKMNRYGITCRIRKNSKGYIATVKNHLLKKRFKSTEHEILLGNSFNDKCFTRFNLILFGCMRTERAVVISNNLKLMLDKNTYLNCTDYELEIEYFDNCEGEAQLLLENINYILLTYRKKFEAKNLRKRLNLSKTKSQRFFERLQYLNNIKRSMTFYSYE